MIERVVELSLRNRAVVVALCVLLAVLGLDAFRRLPIEAYPDVADTWVQVITQWPGHAAEEVERQITIPAERVLNGVPKQTVLRSTSIAGLSVVTLLFEDGTDGSFARQQVLERLGQMDLPPGVKPQLGPFASPVGEILRYRLVNCATTHVDLCDAVDRAMEPRTLTELKELEEWVVERELLATAGVADVVSFGGTAKQYQVLVDPVLLAARQLTFDDVTRALESANGNAGGGVVGFGEEALNVRGIGLLRAGDIPDVPIATREGTPMRIRSVGRVEEGHALRLGRVSVDADTDVVAATVLLRKGEQAQDVLVRVHERIDAVNAHVLPRGVKIVPYYDRSELFALTTHTVMKNLVEGVVLVTVVLFVFLGNGRAALIVAATIPLSLLVAFVLMDRAHIPANLLSLGALDFGMVVDGAIVMVENVFHRVADARERGEDVTVDEVVRAASRGVARPVVFAIAIIVTAYLPIFTLERVEGKLFSPMAWTVAFALAGALVFAVTLVPVLASLAFRKGVRERHGAVLAALHRVYGRALRRLLPRARAVVPVAGALLVVNLLLARSLGTEFLPELDEGAIWLRATLPANVSFDEVTALVDGVHTGEREVVGLREILARFPEVLRTATHIGRPDDGTDPTGLYNVEMLLVLKPHDAWRPELHGDKDELVEAIGGAVAAMPGVAFNFSQPISDNVAEAVTGVKGQLAVKITGDDLHALDDLADQVARQLARVGGVVDLGIFRELGQSNVHVEIARERAERYGLTVGEVEDVVEKGVGGTTATYIAEGERRFPVVARYAPELRRSVDGLRDLLIPLPGGTMIPLAQVADVRVVGGASRIYREGSRRYIAVKFGVRGRDMGSAVAEAQKRVERSVRLPPGYTMTWGGEFESARRAGRRLAVVVPMTLVGIFVLLFVMFGRAREALIVLGNVVLTSPLGGLAALFLSGTHFSVSAGVGLLALFGVSVQTGVILVSTIGENCRAGLPRDAAIEAACERRLRPMLMTGLVATLGLLPAALSTGIGSDSQKPLAIVVVGGLLSSLVLSLLGLPLLYRLFGSEKPPSAAKGQES